jgi:hypothetical protein
VTSGQSFSFIQPGLDAVNAFADGNAKNGILTPPGGILTSAWFVTGDTFKVMTWSDGTIIGSGTNVIT